MSGRETSFRHLGGAVVGSAKRLLEQHGPGAGRFACERLEAAIDAGEPAEIETWRAIVSAVAHLQANGRF